MIDVKIFAMYFEQRERRMKQAEGSQKDFTQQVKKVAKGGKTKQIFIRQVKNKHWPADQLNNAMLFSKIFIAFNLHVSRDLAAYKKRTDARTTNTNKMKN